MQKKILSILIVGLILASSAMPNLFFKWFDPIVYLMVDGSWIAADIVQYLLAAVFILMISHLLLHWKKWPWDVLILWIPYLFWCLLSYFWSIYPSYSVHESIHDVFIAQVVFIFAYALAVSRVLDFKTLFSIFFIVLMSCALAAIWLPFESISGAGLLFDGVLFSNWYAYCIAVVIPFVWLDVQKGRFARASWVFVLLLMFSFLASMRIAWLASLACWLFCAAVGIKYYRSEVGSKWKKISLFLLWIVFLFIGYKYIANFKSVGMSDSICAIANGVVNTADQQGGWYKTFTDNERYQIWGFYIRESLDKWLMGVGLGWETPAYSYARYKPDCFPLVWVSHGHNHLINQYLQLGVIGVLLYLSAWLGIFIKMSRCFVSKRRTARQAALVSLILLAMLLAKNFTDDGMRDQNVLLYFMLLGYFFGRARQAADDSGTEHA